MRKLVVLGTFVGGLLLAQSHGFITMAMAADNGAGSKSGAPGKQEAQEKMLEAEVEVVELDLQDLRDLGLDLKKVRQAASTLNDECNRTPVNIQTMPNYIGNGIVINTPVAFNASGPALPLRKKAVDGSMAAIRPFILQAREDVDAFEAGKKELSLPPKVLKELEPTFTEWRATIKDAGSQLDKLEPLTQGPPYQNQSIASAASAIDKDMQSLERNRRTVYKVLQREGKDAKRKERRKD